MDWLRSAFFCTNYSSLKIRVCFWSSLNFNSCSYVRLVSALYCVSWSNSSISFCSRSPTAGLLICDFFSWENFLINSNPSDTVLAILLVNSREMLLRGWIFSRFLFSAYCLRRDQASLSLAFIMPLNSLKCLLRLIVLTLSYIFLFASKTLNAY
jgi:hypothetical protein